MGKLRLKGLHLPSSPATKGKGPSLDPVLRTRAELQPLTHEQPFLPKSPKGSRRDMVFTAARGGRVLVIPSLQRIWWLMSLSRLPNLIPLTRVRAQHQNQRCPIQRGTRFSLQVWSVICGLAGAEETARQGRWTHAERGVLSPTHSGRPRVWGGSPRPASGTGPRPEFSMRAGQPRPRKGPHEDADRLALTLSQCPVKDRRPWGQDSVEGPRRRLLAADGEVFPRTQQTWGCCSRGQVRGEET